MVEISSRCDGGHTSVVAWSMSGDEERLVMRPGSPECGDCRALVAMLRRGLSSLAWFAVEFGGVRDAQKA